MNIEIVWHCYYSTFFVCCKLISQIFLPHRALMVGKRRGRHGTQGRRLGNGRCLRPGPPGDDPEADGLDFDKTTAEGKLIAALLDLTGELCDAVNELDERANPLNDYIEEIDEDLGAVEEYLLDELEEDDDD